jgi:hypothetical protein
LIEAREPARQRFGLPSKGLFKSQIDANEQLLVGAFEASVNSAETVTVAIFTRLHWPPETPLGRFRLLLIAAVTLSL